MFLILTLIILVAAFNIISSMIMPGVRKMLISRCWCDGSQQGSIIRVFLMTGASIGVVGTTWHIFGSVVLLEY